MVQFCVCKGICVCIAWTLLLPLFDFRWSFTVVYQPLILSLLLCLLSGAELQSSDIGIVNCLACPCEILWSACVSLSVGLSPVLFGYGVFFAD
jgi:hypothetical protein